MVDVALTLVGAYNFCGTDAASRLSEVFADSPILFIAEIETR